MKEMKFKIISLFSCLFGHLRARSDLINKTNEIWTKTLVFYFKFMSYLQNTLQGQEINPLVTS